MADYGLRIAAWTRRARRPGLCALGLLLAGCTTGRQPVAPQPVQPSPANPVPGAAPPSPTAPAVTGEAAGPVRLGMPAAEVLELPNLTVVPWEDRKLEGRPAPALRIQQFGLPIGYAELKDGKVWRIVLVSEGHRTPEGAHVGMTAEELQRIYGPGRVLTGEGNVCATFEKAPGLSFCFRSTPELQKLSSGGWSQLAVKNPKVQRILVTGG